MDVVQLTDSLALGSEVYVEESAAVQCSTVQSAVRILRNTVERSVCFQICLTS
jgi:hypothetical protein